jgi:hypothetical protein
MPGMYPSNAAPEWQASISGGVAEGIGGLSTRGVCSKVWDLNRELLQAFVSPSDFTPILHLNLRL